MSTGTCNKVGALGEDDNLFHFFGSNSMFHFFLSSLNSKRCSIFHLLTVTQRGGDELGTDEFGQFIVWCTSVYTTLVTWCTNPDIKTSAVTNKLSSFGGICAH